MSLFNEILLVDDYDIVEGHLYSFVHIDSFGENSVVMAAGYNSIVKAKKGSWITLAEWKEDKNMGKLIPVCVKTEMVDGEKIKEDTLYKLVNGEFKEVKE